MESLEIAVYEAKSAESFGDSHERIHHELPQRFAGCIGSLGLRSLTKPEVFADLVLWESQAAATAAADAMATMEELAWFHAELGPIQFFDHFEPSSGHDALTGLIEASVVELVAVRPADTAAYTDAHIRLHQEHLAEADEVLVNVRLDGNANGLSGDVNGWVSSDAMEATGPRMMSKPELKAVFDETNEIVLFMPFTVTVTAGAGR